MTLTDLMTDEIKEREERTLKLWEKRERKLGRLEE
jgi:hypothetical protein